MSYQNENLFLFEYSPSFLIKIKNDFYPRIDSKFKYLRKIDFIHLTEPLPNRLTKIKLNHDRFIKRNNLTGDLLYILFQANSFKYLNLGKAKTNADTCP